MSREKILEGITYQPKDHYKSDDGDKEPKRIFVRLADIIEEAKFASGQRLLDVGCANGELLRYIGRRFSNLDLTGLDISSELLDEALRLAPYASFIEGSALDIPSSLHGGFDIVTGVGLVGVFDELELEHYLDQLFECARQGGRIYLLEPFNEFGMDLVAKHRKRIGDRLGDWERGNSIFAKETLVELVSNRCKTFRFHDFHIDIKLERREDVQRTWTVETDKKNLQLTNGLKILFDLYVFEIVV